MQRVERELFQSLTLFLQHEIISTLPSYAAITAVGISPDLRQAKVYFRLVGLPENLRRTEVLLSEQRGQFQKCVSKNLSMKFCPSLRFVYGAASEPDAVDLLFENL